MSFLSEFNKFQKEITKMDGVSLIGDPPKFWIDFGNYCINKVMSGSYTKGIAQGRITLLAGPSGAGKSFIAANCAKAALAQGYGVLVIDSENALDDGFMEKIGIDVKNPLYRYSSLNTIADCTKVVAKFTKFYRAEQRKEGKTPQFLIMIDSLDMLRTSSEEKNYESGIIKGDQGQQAKQLKKMLATFVQDIKDLDVAMVCTKQVYQEQDPIAAMTNPWKITQSLRFACSQLVLITKLLFKDKKTKIQEGIRLKAYGEKTRFTKPFQQCIIEVPYETGMNPYTGVVQAGVAMGIVELNGAWYDFNGAKFQTANFHKHEEQILQELIKLEDGGDDGALVVETGEAVDLSDVITKKEMTSRRLKKKKK